MVRTRTGTTKGKRDEAPTQGVESRPPDADNHPAAIASKSLAIAGKGIYTGEDFAAFMSALMSDLMKGTVTPDKANAICNAGGKLLKVVEMRYRYGKDQPQRPPSFVLVASNEFQETPSRKRKL